MRIEYRWKSRMCRDSFSRQGVSHEAIQHHNQELYRLNYVPDRHTNPRDRGSVNDRRIL